jgi:hypothetical protein
MTEDREWIIRTALDPQATRGEFEAAIRAATPAELRAIEDELEMATWFAELRQRDVRGKLAHLAEQYAGLRALE